MKPISVIAIIAWGCLSLAIATGSSAQDETKDEAPDAAAAEAFRTWTDASGEYRVEAVIDKFEAGRVHLRERDGNTKRIALGKLSKDDQKYVREWAAKQKENPAKTRTGRGSTPSSAGGANWPGWLGPNRDGNRPTRDCSSNGPRAGPRCYGR